MLNYNTLLSNYDDKLTLLQFLKKVEAALADASLESVEVSQPTETQAVLTFKFADGSELAAPAIELPRGASVVNATLDASNNLILVLDDGRTINVGNIMPQNINAQSGTFSVSLASPSVTAGSLSVSGNASVVGELYADRVRTDGLESYGNVKGAGLDISGSGSVGGDLAVTGDVTAASFNGDNAKPLYFHPVTIYDGSEKLRLEFIIINNDPTAFTWSTFKAFVIALSVSFGSVARFLCNGAYYDSVNASLVVTQVMDVTSNYLRVWGLDSTGTNRYKDIQSFTPAEFYDGVNKIN